MYSEDDLLPLSALQHLLFCERQCMLIHVEQAWSENRLTAEGRLLHERVHEGEDESRRNVRIVRGLRLRSLRLGLTGVADVVEFRHCESGESGVELANAPGLWHPFPVEYKRGKPKPDDSDKVQLCAQALCLEEMLSATVPEGAMFYGQPRRRLDVSFDEALRGVTEQTAERLHRLLETGQTPAAVYSKKCANCSLVHLCLPETAGRGKSAVRYLGQMV